MRVLLLSTEFAPPGGVQFVARLIASALPAHYGPALRLDAVSLLDGPECQLGGLTGIWRGCGGRRARFAAAAGELLVRHRYDAVIVNHLHLLPLIAGTMIVRRSPIYLVIHGIEAWITLPQWRLAGLGAVRRILYASAFSRSRAEAANAPLAVREGLVVHHALPETGSVPTKPAVDQPPVALMVGRMAAGERYKGFDEMISVWPEVSQRVPGAELWLAGDGDDRLRLEAEARSRNVIARFLGRVDASALQALFDRCRCFCLPSSGEGFGLVYLEAMRAARPVLCGLDAAMEIVIDGVTGRTVDPRNAVGLVDAVAELFGEKGCRMGEAGRARFLDRFTFEAYVQRLGEAIDMDSKPPHQTELIKNDVG